VHDVQERLSQRFPRLGDEVVEAAVRVAYSKLTGPVRDFVPVLVEHDARERLSVMADYSSQHAHRPLVGS
jgi:hypothetical protein